MTDHGPELSSLQDWMQTVITDADGVIAAAASESARRHFDVDPAQIESIVTPSTSLSGAERLAIYSRSYHARLLECLRAQFPAVRHALGDELFEYFTPKSLIFDVLGQVTGFYNCRRSSAAK